MKEVELLYYCIAFYGVWFLYLEIYKEFKYNREMLR